MREIKFRAFHEFGKGMCTVRDIDFYGKIILIETKGYDNFEFNLSDIKLMQFTGLKDKNKKDIYEGDVVKFNFDNSTLQGTGEIIFDKGMYLVKVINKPSGANDSFSLGGFDYDEQFCEVIGNIYENPDLLEDGK